QLHTLYRDLKPKRGQDGRACGGDRDPAPASGRRRVGVLHVGGGCVIKRELLKIQCPCGGTVYAGLEPEHFLLHSSPPCSDFERMPIHEFLKWLREKIEATLPKGPA